MQMETFHILHLAACWSGAAHRPEEEDDADADDADAESDEEAEETTPFLKAQATAIASVLEDTVQARAMSIDPLAPSSAFDETLRDRLREDAVKKRKVTEEEVVVADEDEEALDERGEGTSGVDPNERLLERNWVAPAGKRVAVPVRIEPKVYFASERTFLVSSIPLQT